jgi:hypothetical protein
VYILLLLLLLLLLLKYYKTLLAKTLMLIYDMPNKIYWNILNHCDKHRIPVLKTHGDVHIMFMWHNSQTRAEATSFFLGMTPMKEPQRPLPTQHKTNTRDEHPYPQRESNP